MQPEGEHHVAGGYRDELLAAHGIGQRRRVYAGADRDVPQLLPAFSVEREEIAVDRAAEDQVTGGREEAGRGARLYLELPA